MLFNYWSTLIVNYVVCLVVYNLNLLGWNFIVFHLYDEPLWVKRKKNRDNWKIETEGQR
jgi:hypothetical protein